MKTPAVERAIRILDFLATHPGESFSLSDISRRVGISKATTHAVLAALTAGGYLRRDAGSRRYSLGPALIPLGTVAEQALPAVSHARAAAREVADSLGVQCIVVWATETELVYLTHHGVPRASGFSGAAGQRVPLVPPMGTVFMAWSASASVDAWLTRLGPAASSEQLARYRTALADVRRRGYAVGYKATAYTRLGEIYAKDGRDVHSPDVRDELDAILAELGREPYLPTTDGDDRPLANLSVPVFDAKGSMILALSLLLDERFSSADLPALVDPLLRAAGTVMNAINGRRPDVSYLGAASDAG